MEFHRRDLPHYCPSGAILFVTWRLFGSLPRNIGIGAERALDGGPFGPVWLKDGRVAGIVGEALRGGALDCRYDLPAWVAMPNHVHVVFQPREDLSGIVKWIKGSTARAANLVLGRTGKPFWQVESYDHCVRSTGELQRVIQYVEKNPVRVGLCESAADWRWSSAG